MAKKQEILDFEIFVGDRPLNDLTPQEREDFSNRVVERMGNTLNNYYSHHPQEWIALCKSLDAKRQGDHCNAI